MYLISSCFYNTANIVSDLLSQHLETIAEWVEHLCLTLNIKIQGPYVFPQENT